MKKIGILSVLPALMIGTSSFASSDVLSFSGKCQLSLKGQAYTSVGSFHLEGTRDECPNETIEFSVPGTGYATQYGIYVEFQRGEFGPGLRDKAFFGYYEKSDGAMALLETRLVPSMRSRGPS
jgi:hypothetical protein